MLHLKLSHDKSSKAQGVHDKCKAINANYSNYTFTWGEHFALHVFSVTDHMTLKSKIHDEDMTLE